MPAPAVTVIDIGSNTIKVLVASRAPDGLLQTELFQSIDARISTGIGRAGAELSAEGMARGIAAVRQLLAAAAKYQPVRTILVATSAVRDAANGAAFRTQVKTATGHDIRILTGEEEANYIGLGLTCDPALAALQDFYVFDLGGGSLECLAFKGRRVQQAASLQLGCVRLTEQLFPDSDRPLPADAATQIAQLCAGTFAVSGFRFNLAPDAVAVGTGGTLTVARAIEANLTRATDDLGSSLVTIEQLKSQFFRISALSLEGRRRVPGLPAARADVYPTALATLISVATLGLFDAYRHSLYNLRYGLAHEALA